jgi:hypothetical protein
VLNFAAIASDQSSAHPTARGCIVRRFDPFLPLEPAVRREQLDAHRAMMRERDGDLDLGVRTLAHRERFLAELDADPVHARCPIDLESFETQWHRPHQPADDPRIDWIAAAMRANEGETYGVELELDRFSALRADEIDSHLLSVALEDHYHAKILGYFGRIFGVDVEIQRPRPLTRFFTRCMNYLPTPLRMVFILAGEVVGNVFFRILLDRCDVFRDDPDAQARLRRLVEEIVIDETGHVAFCRARVSERLLPVARWLAPRIASGLLREIPEFTRLAGSDAAVLRRVRDALPVPDSVSWLGEEATA